MKEYEIKEWVESMGIGWKTDPVKLKEQKQAQLSHAQQRAYETRQLLEDKREFAYTGNFPDSGVIMIDRRFLNGADHITRIIGAEITGKT